MAQLVQTSLINDANLFAYYQLEGTTDYLGSHNLSNINSVAFNPGLYLNAADFSSSNTNKFLSNGAFTFGNNAACSLSFWVKLTAEITSGTYCFSIIGETTSGKYLQVLYEYNGGAQRIKLDNSNTTGTFTLTMGTTGWYHIVATRDSSHNADLWINGIKQISAIGQGAGTSGGDRVFIGTDNGATLYASCLVDDLAVFTRVLTQSEILTLAANSSSSLLAFEI